MELTEPGLRVKNAEKMQQSKRASGEEMRPLINKKLKLMSELTEHTLANEIEAPHEILRK